MSSRVSWTSGVVGLSQMRARRVLQEDRNCVHEPGVVLQRRLGGPQRAGKLVLECFLQQRLPEIRLHGGPALSGIHADVPLLEGCPAPPADGPVSVRRFQVGQVSRARDVQRVPLHRFDVRI